MVALPFKSRLVSLYHILEPRIENLLSPILPITTMEKVCGTPIVPPYYHLVSDERVNHVIHLYRYRNTRQFRADLDFFLTRNKPLDLRDLLDSIENRRPLPEKSFFLSFDDGFREVFDVVAPILREKGIPATFFLTTSFRANKVLGYRHKISLLIEQLQTAPSKPKVNAVFAVLDKYGIKNQDIENSILSISYEQRHLLDEIAQVLDLDFDDYLANKKPYLNTHQVKQLIKEGFTIGAHSVDHVHYKSLTPDKQIAQTIESMRELRDRFSLEYSIFAFPYSDHSVPASFFAAMSEYVSLFFGSSGFMTDKISTSFQRFPMETTNEPAQSIVKKKYIDRLLRESIGKNTIKRF